MSTFVFGDIHGKWDIFNKEIEIIEKNTQEDILIISVGDFGYWPKFEEYNLNKIKFNFNRTKIFFIDGNHEDHWSLKNIQELEVSKNIFYMRRGTIYNLNNSNILFIGGADSIDKKQRTIGLDWFYEEIIGYNDFETLANIDEKIDIVISHTCPEEWLKEFHIYDNDDPSCKALSYILENFKPPLWYFGHFHQFKSGKYKNTKWIALGDHNFPQKKWYTELCF